jgi:hypothetical protein
VTRLIILSGSVPLKADNGTYYFPPGGYPKDVDFNGVKKQVYCTLTCSCCRVPRYLVYVSLWVSVVPNPVQVIAAQKAGVKHVLLVSSMGTTTPNSFLDRLGNGQALFYKLNGEAALMSAGLPFTIVKPAGLLGEELPAGETNFHLREDSASFRKHSPLFRKYSGNIQRKFGIVPGTFGIVMHSKCL